MPRGGFSQVFAEGLAVGEALDRTIALGYQYPSQGAERKEMSRSSVPDFYGGDLPSEGEWVGCASAAIGSARVAHDCDKYYYQKH